MMRPVPPNYDAILAAWSKASEWIADALDAQDRHGYTLKDVYASIVSGRCALWLDEHAACVVHVTPHPKGNVCVLWLGGGKLESFIESMPALLDWIAPFNCVGIEVHGRRGWEKPLSKIGFRRAATTFVHDITPAATVGNRHSGATEDGRGGT